MPPSKFHTIILSAKGEVKQAQIPFITDKPTAEEIHAYMRKKEAPDAQVACHMKGRDVILWGYRKGKGAFNAHVLPIENDFYGDIIVFSKDNTELKVKDWLSGANLSGGSASRNGEAPGSGGSKRGKKAAPVAEEEEAPEPQEGKGEEEEAEEEEEDDEEDEEDEEEDEEEEEEDEDDALEDAEAAGATAADLEEEEEEAPAPKKKVTKKKPKLTTAFAKQQALLEDDAFEEITPENYEPNEVTLTVLTQFFAGTEMTEEKIQDLESAIFVMAFNEAKKRHVISHWKNPLFKQLYKNTLMRVISNLSPDSYVGNKRLYEKVVSGEVEIAHMADFNPYDLYPENWKELEDRRIMRENAYMEGNKGRATDQFKCNRCKKSECTYYEMQTRSADEPMTLFITCVNCGKRWRQ